MKRFLLTALILLALPGILGAQVTMFDTPAPTMVDTTSIKFTLNQRVQTTATLNIRATANGTLLGAQAAGAIGTVIAGPVVSGGYTWWNVNFDSGTDGWGAEDWLMVDVAPAIIPTVSTPPTADTTAPTVPKGLTASNITATGATLSWTASTDTVGVKGYTVRFYVSGLLGPSWNVASGTTFNATLTSNTSYTVTVSAYDLAGNESAQSTGVTVVTLKQTDTTAPTVPTGLTASATATSVTVSWTASTDNVGVTGYKLYRGGALVTTGNMLTYTDYDLTVNTTYTVSAYDAAGNVSAQSTGVTVTTPATADTTAPTVSLSGITSGASYTSAQTVTINATASDNSGVSKVEFYDNNVLKGTDTASPYSYSWSIASSADNGTHAWTVKAYDATGNTATSGSVSVTVNIPIAVADTTAPSIFAWSTIPTASFSINPYTLTAAQTVNISITVSDNIGVSKVEFYDGTTLKATNTTSPYSFTWGVTSADNGTHSLMMKAYDAAGNVASSVATSVIVNIVTADTTAPTVSLSASATSITTAQTVTFTATASDNVGVSSVTFTYGAYSSVSTDNTSPYSLSLNLSSSHNGIYTVTAKAYDTTGNSATSNTVSVSVNIPIDTTAPTKPTNLKATNITSTDTTLSWTASTDNVGVTGYVVKVYLSGLLGPAYNVTSGTTFTVSGLTPSTSYTYTVYAKDASYNASAESTAVTVKTLAAVASAATGWSQSASVLGAMGNSTNNGMDVTRASSQVKTKTTLTYNWTRNLQVGSSYQDDITALQTALVDQGMFTEEVSGGFYSKTFIAVKAFQKKYGINPTGFVGPLTRAKLNELYR